MKSGAKMKEIHKNISGSSFSVILATETSWNDSVRSEEVFGSDFNVFRDDRNLQESQKKSGGGVLIALKANFNSELITTAKCIEFEHVWVKSHIAGEILVFAAVYFPPHNARKASYEKFFQIGENILSELPAEIKIHIYGDFNQRNADFIQDSENEQILLPVVGENETLQFIFDKIASLGLNQINHIKNEHNCYLDFLLTNIHEDFCVSESLSPLWKNEASHTAIEYSLFVHDAVRPIDCEFEEVFDYHKGNYDNIRRKLSCINWQTLLKNEGNVATSVDIFYKILFKIIHDEVPLIRKRRFGNSKYPIWYNRDLKNLKNRKQKAHKIFKNQNCHENLVKYLEACD